MFPRQSQGARRRLLATAAAASQLHYSPVRRHAAPHTPVRSDRSLPHSLLCGPLHGSSHSRPLPRIWCLPPHQRSMPPHLPAHLPACLPARPPACPPACLPQDFCHRGSADHGAAAEQADPAGGRPAWLAEWRGKRRGLQRVRGPWRRACSIACCVSPCARCRGPAIHPCPPPLPCLPGHDDVARAD
jgi:hypothetical protein